MLLRRRIRLTGPITIVALDVVTKARWTGTLVLFGRDRDSPRPRRWKEKNVVTPRASARGARVRHGDPTVGHWGRRQRIVAAAQALARGRDGLLADFCFVLGSLKGWGGSTRVGGVVRATKTASMSNNASRYRRRSCGAVARDGRQGALRADALFPFTRLPSTYAGVSTRSVCSSENSSPATRNYCMLQRSRRCRV